MCMSCPKFVVHVAVFGNGLCVILAAMYIV